VCKQIRVETLHQYQAAAGIFWDSHDLSIEVEALGSKSRHTPGEQCRNICSAITALSVKPRVRQLIFDIKWASVGSTKLIVRVEERGHDFTKSGMIWYTSSIGDLRDIVKYTPRTVMHNTLLSKVKNLDIQKGPNTTIAHQLYIMRDHHPESQADEEFGPVEICECVELLLRAVGKSRSKFVVEMRGLAALVKSGSDSKA
jgi:hypothetical protein